MIEFNYFICITNSILCLMHKLKHTHTNMRTYGQIREKYAAGTVYFYIFSY